MTEIISAVDIKKLRRRAKKLNLRIAYDRQYNRYQLVDLRTNVAYGGYMTLEKIEDMVSDFEHPQFVIAYDNNRARLVVVDLETLEVLKDED